MDYDEHRSSGSWETVLCDSGDSDDSDGGVQLDNDETIKSKNKDTTFLQGDQTSETGHWSIEKEEDEEDTASRSSSVIYTPTTSEASDSKLVSGSDHEFPRNQNGNDGSGKSSSGTQTPSSTPSQSSIHIDLFPYDSSSDSGADVANQQEDFVTTVSSHGSLNIPDMGEELRRISDEEHDDRDGVLVPVPDELEEEQYDVIDNKDI